MWALARLREASTPVSLAGTWEQQQANSSQLNADDTGTTFWVPVLWPVKPKPFLCILDTTTRTRPDRNSTFSLAGYYSPRGGGRYFFSNMSTLINWESNEVIYLFSTGMHLTNICSVCPLTQQYITLWEIYRSVTRDWQLAKRIGHPFSTKDVLTGVLTKYKY